MIIIIINKLIISSVDGWTMQKVFNKLNMNFLLNKQQI